MVTGEAVRVWGQGTWESLHLPLDVAANLKAAFKIKSLKRKGAGLHISELGF